MNDGDLVEQLGERIADVADRASPVWGAVRLARRVELAIGAEVLRQMRWAEHHAARAAVAEPGDPDIGPLTIAPADWQPDDAATLETARAIIDKNSAALRKLAK